MESYCYLPSQSAILRVQYDEYCTLVSQSKYRYFYVLVVIKQIQLISIKFRFSMFFFKIQEMTILTANQASLLRNQNTH